MHPVGQLSAYHATPVSDWTALDAGRASRFRPLEGRGTLAGDKYNLCLLASHRSGQLVLARFCTGYVLEGAGGVFGC